MDQVFSILKFIGIIIEVLVIFNLLIIVHEWGHFLAARWRGAVIEGFGVWFGKPLWKKKINGVTYSLGSIPFGGFVKLPQLMDTNLEGQSEFAGKELPRLKPLDKIIIAAAGPIFSLLLAFFFALIVWSIGRPMGEAERTTTIGAVQKDSVAEKAKLKAGDKLLTVDGHPVHKFGGQSEDSVMWRIVRSEGETIPITYQRGDEVKTANLKPEIPSASWYQRRGLRRIGIGPMSTPMIAAVEPSGAAEKAGLKPNDLIVAVNGQSIYEDRGLLDYAQEHPGVPLKLTVKRPVNHSEKQFETLDLDYELRGPIIGGVVEGSPAQTVGLQAGDRVVALDGKPIRTPGEFIDYIQAREGVEVAITIKRPLPRQHKKDPIQYEEKERIIKIKPEIPEETVGAKKPSIGIAPLLPGLDFALDLMGPRDLAFPTPMEQIVTSVKQITSTIGAVASKSNIGVQHMGGPVMMMRVYYNLFESPHGWRLALWFSVIINVNLALLNLLPIPPLDGSHITLGLVEIIRRKPVKGKLLEYIMGPFTLLVIGFMLFVTFYDVQDLFGGKKQEMRFKQPPSAQPSS